MLTHIRLLQYHYHLKISVSTNSTLSLLVITPYWKACYWQVPALHQCSHLSNLRGRTEVGPRCSSKLLGKKNKIKDTKANNGTRDRSSNEAQWTKKDQRRHGPFKQEGRGAQLGTIRLRADNETQVIRMMKGAWGTRGRQGKTSK